MSGPAFTDPINAAQPDFVVVALGARKGQAWISRNWPQLHAPVISHLGAVVNFSAGTIKRAPAWVQRGGLEWLWRIKEEPSLWRRYWHDGQVLLRYLVTQALPWVLFNRSSSDDARPLKVEVERHGDECVIRLQGSASNGPRLAPLRSALAEACAKGWAVSLDLAEVTDIGTSFVGLVQLLDGWQRFRSDLPVLAQVPSRIARAFHWAGASYLLEPREERIPATAPQPSHIKRVVA
jgi:N-acetylglucosaminyldiphosphoundecaprenol N-acetyl-beta-D-mannosaminyltransferase